MGLCFGISSILSTLVPCGPSSQTRSISMDSFSEPPPSASLPEPCDIRRLTIGFLNSYSASTCPYNDCLGCREPDALDRQITEMHNFPIDLPNRRHAIMGRINGRHDLFTSHFPIELISNIFNLITNLSNDDRIWEKDNKLAWNPALQLGAVCRRWREITLSTPKLWTHLIVIPRKHGAFPDIAEQWLSRSLTLPLTLKVLVQKEMHDEFLESSPPLPYQNIVRLLRSHANRWKDLTVEGPIVMFHMLLTGMETKLSVDSLDISLYDSASFGSTEITMKHPFSPQSLWIAYSPLHKIPIEWDRLTELWADRINLDAFLHIFRHAHNLHRCFADYIEDKAGHYPMDISPVTNTSIEVFETTWEGMHGTFPFYILQHLSLPSLKKFECGIEAARMNADLSEELEMLAEFVDRHPPFEDFLFSHFDFSSRHGAEWYLPLSSITSLDLQVREHSDGRKIQGYLDGLAHRQPIALPRLRELKIHTEEWNAGCWKALAAMFPDYDHSEDEDPPLVNHRPLKTVKISMKEYFFNREPRPEEIIPEEIYARLCAIQKAGVKLQVFDRDEIAIFGPTE